MTPISARATAVLLALTLAAPATAQVTISQVYGGGGNTGAPLRSDFIELHNNGSSAVSLDGWSVQYASSTGTSWQRTNLAGELAPGGYYLIKQADGSNTSAPPLPTPDATGTIAMSGSAGKVALVNSTTTLSGSCPNGQIDFVGFGTATNCAEGAAPTANLSNSTAALRADDGCSDSNNNAADFTIAAPGPRNRASAVRVCGSSLPVLGIDDVSVVEGNTGEVALRFTLSLSRPAETGGVSLRWSTANGTAIAGDDFVAALDQTASIAAGESSTQITVSVRGDTLVEGDETVLVNLSNVTGATLGDAQGVGTISDDDFAITPIAQVQGSGARSPLEGRRVFVEGIVTGVKNNGFFVQSSDGEADTDPATSEGLFVFTGSPTPAAAAVCNRVRVSGLVIEFVPTADPGQAPLTEIGGTPTVTLLSQPPTCSPATLPRAIGLSTTFPAPNGAFDQLERVEAMRVTLPSATVVAPTGGNTNEPNASGTSNGIFSVVVSGLARPFREPGIQMPDNAPGGGSIPPIPRWDFNPELITVDSDALGQPTLNWSTGSVLTDLTGPLDYGFRRYTVLMDATPWTGAPGPAPRAAALPGKATTVASYNLERFFDDSNDPAIGEPVLTPAAFARRLQKASLAVRDYLHTPDILGTVEVENLSTLQRLAERINADALAAGQPDPGYTAHLLEGNDVGGIDVGYLVRSRVQVQAVTQIGKDTTWVEPNGNTSLLNDRPPLMLEAVVRDTAGRNFPLTVVLVHQRSLNGAEDDTADGDRVRQKRQRQAEFLAAFLNGLQTNDPERRLIALGDFNAFEFNDGLADTMNVIAGTPSANETTAVPGDGVDLVEPNLIPLGELLPARERYSYVFGGNAQTLDHVLVNEALVLNTRTLALDHARINADFPATNRNLADSPSRLSDHDPVIAYLTPRARADLAAQVSAVTAEVRVGSTLGFVAALRNLGPDGAEQPGVGFAIDAELPSLKVIPNDAAWTCDDAVVAAGRTSVACVATTLALDASVRFDVTATAGEAQIGRALTLAMAVDAQSLDPVPDNDQASAKTSVFALADLGVTLTGPVRHLRSGTEARYRLEVINAGPDVAATTRVTVRGDAPAANVRLESEHKECTISNTAEGFLIDCAVGTLRMTPPWSLPLRIIAPPRSRHGSLTISAAASSISRDSAPANNSAAHRVIVIGRPF